jgi:DNA-binding transcriptional LysR family regulator
LGLTQPAVTKQLNQLEQELGVKLLRRQGRGVRLTPAGEVLYHYARRINHLVEQAAEAVHALYQPGQGEVRIGAVSTVGLSVLPTVLARFSARYPLVKVRVQILEIQDNVDRLLQGDLELALVTVPVAHPQIVSLPLYADPVVLVASPDTAARLPSPLTADRVSGLDQISYQAPSRFRSFVDGMLEQHGILPRVIMEFNSHEAIKAMVELGLGVAFMPRSVVETDLAAGRLAALTVEGLPPMTRITSLLLPTDGHATPSLQHLVETLLTLYPVPYESLPAWIRAEPLMRSR